ATCALGARTYIYGHGCGKLLPAHAPAGAAATLQPVAPARVLPERRQGKDPPALGALLSARPQPLTDSLQGLPSQRLALAVAVVVLGRHRAEPVEQLALGLHLRPPACSHSGIPS